MNRVKEIILDESVYLKAKIFVMAEKNMCIKIIKPKWEERYNVLNELNNKWLKHLKTKGEKDDTN